MHADILAAIEEAASQDGLFLWLTGAGISAESGIPTFRGPDGYWTVGSENYRAEELATNAAFRAMPKDVWSWYLWRRSVCRGAEPNAAHHALVALEESLGDRFRLITQNVDGLHLRAGQTRMYEIHGDIERMRAGARVARVPDGFHPWARGQQLSDAEHARLNIDGRPARPHVLWFDETYDEENFRFESSIAAAANAAMLFIVGSQGMTNLPNAIARVARHRGIPIVLVDPASGAFDAMLESPDWHMHESATEAVPRLCDAIRDAVMKG